MCYMLPYTPKYHLDGVEFDLQEIDGQKYFYITGNFDDVVEDKHR